MRSSSRRWVVLSAFGGCIGVLGALILAVAVSANETTGHLLIGVAASSMLIFAFFIFLLWLLLSEIRSQTALIARTRKESSTYEYRIREDLQRMRSMLEGIRSDTEGALSVPGNVSAKCRLPYPENGNRVLFVTSNGAGMGHLVRCLAVAEAGKGSFYSQFVSLSSAANVVEVMGYKALTFRHPPSEGSQYHRWEREFSIFMHEAVGLNSPDALVYDGPQLLRGVVEAANRIRVPLIWIRRGLWKEGSNHRAAQESSYSVSSVITPGDLIHDAGSDPSTLLERSLVTEPITLFDSATAFSRHDACVQLDLDPTQRHVLIQLGAGIINDTKYQVESAIGSVLALGDEWNPVLALSPLSASTSVAHQDAQVIRRFPLSPYLSAFTMGVIAAGYNSVHEVIAAGLRCVVVPNLNTTTDNQLLRATAYAKSGLGEYVNPEAPEFEEALSEALRHVATQAGGSPGSTTAPSHGAVTAAAHIASFLPRASGRATM